MKILKILFLSLLIYLSLDYIYTYYITDFRFEKFSNYDEIKAYLDKNYIGKDANELKQLMEKAGATCEPLSKEAWKNWGSANPGSTICYDCNYLSKFIGPNPFMKYSINILIDDNNKILSIGGIVYSTLVI